MTLARLAKTSFSSLTRNNLERSRLAHYQRRNYETQWLWYSCNATISNGCKPKFQRRYKHNLQSLQATSLTVCWISFNFHARYTNSWKSLPCRQVFFRRGSSQAATWTWLTMSFNMTDLKRNEIKGTCKPLTCIAKKTQGLTWCFSITQMIASLALNCCTTTASHNSVLNWNMYCTGHRRRGAAQTTLKWSKSWWGPLQVDKKPFHKPYRYRYRGKGRLNWLKRQSWSGSKMVSRRRRA